MLLTQANPNNVRHAVCSLHTDGSEVAGERQVTICGTPETVEYVTKFEFVHIVRLCMIECCSLPSVVSVPGLPWLLF